MARSTKKLKKIRWPKMAPLILAVLVVISIQIGYDVITIHRISNDETNITSTGIVTQAVNSTKPATIDYTSRRILIDDAHIALPPEDSYVNNVRYTYISASNANPELLMLTDAQAQATGLQDLYQKNGLSSYLNARKLLACIHQVALSPVANPPTIGNYHKDGTVKLADGRSYGIYEELGCTENGSYLIQYAQQAQSY